MPEGDAIRVVLVDDHVLVREGLREILDAHDDLDVVGEAGDSETAVSVVAQTRPDVVLLDVEIPGDDVTATVPRLQAVSPGTKIVILSMYDGPQLVRNLVHLGIAGYLLKSVTRHELVAAIRGAYSDRGRIMLSVSRQSLEAVESGDAPVLSARERDVLQLVAQAMSNAQIASRLCLTEATVKRHLHNIFTKLDAVSRIDAVNKAIAASMITPPKSDTDAPTARRH